MKGLASHVTVSGFLKYEVVGKLKQCMLEKDYTNACYLVAELGCTKNELPVLLDLLLKLFCEHFISSNAWVLQAMAEKLQVFKDLPKKDRLSNPLFQRSLCALLLLIMLGPVKTQNLETFQLPANTFALGSAALHELESLVSEARSPTPAFKARFKGLLSKACYRYLCVLYRCARERWVRKGVELIKFLVSRKEGWVEDAPDTALDGLIHMEDIRKPHRKDVVWYIWATLFQLLEGDEGTDAASTTPAKRTYVIHALTLYKAQYKKKTRSDRMALLLYSYWVVATQSCKLKPMFEDTIAQACQDVHLVFADILPASPADAAPSAPCLDTQPAEEAAQEVPQDEPEPTEARPRATKAGRSDSRPRPNLKYLAMYTYVNEDLQKEITKEKGRGMHGSEACKRLTLKLK